MCVGLSVASQLCLQTHELLRTFTVPGLMTELNQQRLLVKCSKYAENNPIAWQKGDV